MAKTRRVRHAFAGSTKMIRLRIDEGLTPHPDERRVTKRDRGGNKLIDVHNHNGFCVDVRSPMTPTGPVETPKGVSGAGKKLPTKKFDVWVDENGRPIRLTTMGEDRLPVVKTESDDQPKSPANSSKLSRAAQGCVEMARQVKPVKPARRNITKKMVVAYLAEKGYTGSIDSKIEKLARLAIKANLEKAAR